MYNETFLSKTELEDILKHKVNIIQLNKILGAYEMAENVHHGKCCFDGSPHFFHSTRVCKILLDELCIFEPDLLIASLLHDILIHSEDINHHILEYNFGAYAAFLVITLTKDFIHQNVLFKDNLDTKEFEAAGEDGLIIKLSESLDNFRCLKFDINMNPVDYIQRICDRYFPLTEKYLGNEKIQYLIQEIKKERNKILG